MIQTKTHRRFMFTPLRYPGGKTSLFEFFDTIIKQHQWNNMKYIEPYAGGAGAGLSLLLLEKVDSIVINDFDKAIYAFWKSIVITPEAFIEKIEVTPTTIEQWHRQKAIYKAADLSDVLELGFATFFLNRTNRSGILSAGPIGGKEQAGRWKLDARFNRKNLIEKIKLIALYRDRITVTRKDGIALIKKYADNEDAFFYIDPPYFVKGAELYLNSFDRKKHLQLADALQKYRDLKWLLSYDNCKEITDLYKTRGFNPEVFSLNYSLHQQSRVGSEIMVFSDAVKLKS